MISPLVHRIAACLLLTTGCAGFSEAAATDVEASLGRVFFTQKDRTRLDQIRAGKKVDAEEGARSLDEVPAPSPLSAREISVDGFVRRSSGKSTVWINQVPRHENEHTRDIALQAKGSAPAAVRLHLPSGKEVSLKAGQSYDAESNTINDVSGTVPPKPDAPQTKP